MYNLDKKTEIKIIIDKSKLLDNFDFHYRRKNKILRVIENIIITNQIETYEYIDDDKTEIRKRQIFFMDIKMLNFIEHDEFDYSKFIKYNKELLIDIYKQIDRDVFLTITNIDGIPRFIMYIKKKRFRFTYIEEDIDISIDVADNKSFDILYNDIISQIEDAFVLNEYTDEYEEDDYDSIQNGISLERSNWAYWDYLVNNGVYPEDNINLLKCDEYLFNF